MTVLNILAKDSQICCNWLSGRLRMIMDSLLRPKTFSRLILLIYWGRLSILVVFNLIIMKQWIIFLHLIPFKFDKVYSAIKNAYNDFKNRLSFRFWSNVVEEGWRGWLGWEVRLFFEIYELFSHPTIDFIKMQTNNK